MLSGFYTEKSGCFGLCGVMRFGPYLAMQQSGIISRQKVQDFPDNLIQSPIRTSSLFYVFWVSSTFLPRPLPVCAYVPPHQNIYCLHRIGIYTVFTKFRVLFALLFERFLLHNYPPLTIGPHISNIIARSYFEVIHKFGFLRVHAYKFQLSLSLH